MSSVDRREIAHTFNTRRKKRRVAERFEHRLSRCSNRYFTDKIKNSFVAARGQIVVRKLLDRFRMLGIIIFVGQVMQSRTFISCFAL